MGIFIGLMILLKSTPYHMAQGSVHLPRNILDQFNVSESDLYTSSKNTSEVSENVKLAMQHIATHAKAHLEAARSLSVPSSARAAFLVSVQHVSHVIILIRIGASSIVHESIRKTWFQRISSKSIITHCVRCVPRCTRQSFVAQILKCYVFLGFFNAWSSTDDLASRFPNCFCLATILDSNSNPDLK